MNLHPADLHKHRVTCTFAGVSAAFKSRHSPHADLREGTYGPDRVHATYTIRALVTLAVALVAFAVAAPSTAQAGPARWSKPVLTVHVADEAAWAGTDVAGALAQWSPALALVLTDDPAADVTLGGPVASGVTASDVGATATTTTDGATITGCRIALAENLRGQDVTSILAHEVGHCLGLGHAVEGPSVMFWTELGGDKLSPTVTATDLDNVRSMYR